MGRTIAGLSAAEYEKQRRRKRGILPRSVRGVCSLPDCGDPAWAKGMCRRHWRRARFWAQKAPEAPPPRLDVRGEVVERHECWQGLASVLRHGLHGYPPPRLRDVYPGDEFTDDDVLSFAAFL